MVDLSRRPATRELRRGRAIDARAARSYGSNPVVQLAFAVNPTGEDLDTDVAGAGFTELLAELGATVDAGK